MADARLERLLNEVCQATGARLETLPGADRWIFQFALAGGRTQDVMLSLEEGSLRMWTQCTGFASDLETPNLFKELLRRNDVLGHGYFALGSDGGVLMVDAQLLEAATPASLRLSLTNLASVGDHVEGLLSAGEDLF